MFYFLNYLYYLSISYNRIGWDVETIITHCYSGEVGVQFQIKWANTSSPEYDWKMYSELITNCETLIIDYCKIDLENKKELIKKIDLLNSIIKSEKDYKCNKCNKMYSKLYNILINHTCT